MIMLLFFLYLLDIILPTIVLGFMAWAIWTILDADDKELERLNKEREENVLGKFTKGV